MTDVGMRFGTTRVLDNVTFRVAPGQIHGLVGHNGAGKSTLMKIALGSVKPTEGTVAVAGTPLTYSRPAEARDAGVGMVLQELSLIPTLSVADNIFLNDEKTGALGTISARRQRREAAGLLADLGITTIRADRPVAELGIAEQQMIEIAKAVRLSTKLLILDEPTAPLSRAEVSRLFELIRRTAARGIGVVFITHHLREVFEISNEITVMREGRVVLSVPTSGTTLGEVVRAIVGAELAAVEASEVEQPARDVPVLLSVDRLAVAGKLEDVTFELRPGEILGIAGLVGSGRTVLLKALFGEIRPQTGSVALDGRPYAPRGPGEAIRRGVYLIPEDRRVHGAILMHTVEQNVVLSILDAVAPAFVYRPGRARSLGLRMLQALDFRARGLEQPVGELSGGNQQKVVLGKALLAKPRVFLLDEPTFGVDVQTAAEIIRLMRAEADGGKGIVWVSSDLTELLKVADRVLVLADGRVKRIVSRGGRGFSEDAILEAIQRTGTGRPGDPGGGIVAA